MYDLLGIGCATVDDFLRVDVYPTADTKQEILGEDRQGGGLVATALVAAARLGLRCGFIDMLGDDDLSRWVIDDLEREGIDTSPVLRRPDSRPIHATIIVTADGSRTILYSTAGRRMTDADVPPAQVITQCKVFMLDDVNGAALGGLARAARDARQAGVPVVADLELVDYRPLIEAVDHLIVSARWAARVTGISDPADAARALWTPARTAVVVTAGVEGAWWIDGDGAGHQPAFRVQAVDTTGCGDVFHGAYAAALVEGLPLAERVRWAAGAAALKATQLGGRPGCPTRPALLSFLNGIPHTS